MEGWVAGPGLSIHRLISWPVKVEVSTMLIMSQLTCNMLILLQVY